MLKTFERTAGGFWPTDIPSIPGCLFFFFETDMRWLSALLSLSTQERGEQDLDLFTKGR